MTRKTKKMVAVEERFQRPLEELLPEMMMEHGLSGAAAKLGVPTGSINYWLLKFGLRKVTLCLRSNETAEIKRND